MPKVKGAGDEVCGLECVKKDNLQEFKGNVRVIFVEPSSAEIQRGTWEASISTIAQLLNAAAVITVLYFSFICKLPIFISAHIAACTAGFQMFLPSSLLMMNPFFGGSIQLKNKQRKSQHVYLAHLTTIFGVTGGLHILCYVVFAKFPITPHSITGVATLLSAVPALFLGPFLYLSEICRGKEGQLMKKMKYVHAASGVLCFVFSSLCFSTSLFKPSFQKWAGLMELSELPGVLTALVLAYTIIIVKSVDWQMKYNNADYKLVSF